MLRIGRFVPVVALSLISGAVFADSAIVGRASVIDGDTIEVHGMRIRLTGIDAPESSQLCEKAGHKYRCGRRAAMALADKLSAKTVTCTPTGKDRYSRILAQCSVGGEDVNRWMVREGHAVAYRKYSTAYVADEDSAKAAKRGVWAGSFQNPWDYRHDAKATPRATKVDAAQHRS